jgi:glycosyltransferase involved in cell wall biosynthesis
MRGHFSDVDVVAAEAHEGLAAFDPDAVLFVFVSFEGPDPYSQAGGLGVRVSGLVDALATAGHETHLFFIGDPKLPGEETRNDGRLVLHRWGQWISANCPGGAYDGEAGKTADLTASLPSFVVERIVAPAVEAGRLPIAVLEEWQTAECACRISDLLTARGMRRHAVVSWNANNPYGFERIDWARLAASTTITTISRYMRSIIRSCGADARIIPNGLPAQALEPVPARDVERMRAIMQAQSDAGFLFKMARWEREKGWRQALDSVRLAREANAQRRPILIARSGGPTGSGSDVVDDAESRGLRVVSFESEAALSSGLAEAARANVDVVSLRFGVSPALARTLYAAADGVLANSISEPFGLVGLETMAAGGVAFTGGTGEDYAIGGRNAIVLETTDPTEIVARWNELAASPQLGLRLRRAARRTARDYACPLVVERMTRALVARPAYEHYERAGADDVLGTVDRRFVPGAAKVVRARAIRVDYQQPVRRGALL